MIHFPSSELIRLAVTQLGQVWPGEVLPVMASITWTERRTAPPPPPRSHSALILMQELTASSASPREFGWAVRRPTPAGITGRILTSSSSFLIKALKVWEFKVKHQKRTQTRRVNMCLLQPGRRRRFKRAARLINQSHFQMRWRAGGGATELTFSVRS